MGELRRTIKWYKDIITLVMCILLIMLAITIAMLHVPSISQRVQLPLSIIRVLDMAYPILFPISILTFVAMVVKIARKKKQEYPPPLWSDMNSSWQDLPLRSIACFLLSVLCIAVFDASMTLGLRNLTKAFNLQIDDVPEVKINGEPAENPQELVMVLRRLRALPAHHSHATSTIKVTIASRKGELLLELGRDSQRPKEYWVFYPSLSVYTPRRHIGGIVTNILDDY